MNIKFIIDQEFDLKVFIYLLRREHWEGRANNSGIPFELAKKIHEAKNDNQLNEAKNELTEIGSNIYLNSLPYIEKSKELYQYSWDEIINEFSTAVEKLTYPFFYNEYVCVLTHFCQGVSDWNGNKIGRTWKENSDTQRRITAHEIILAHYFSIHKNLYKDRGLNDKQIWSLAEIAAFALTGLETKLTKFWPWDLKGYYTDHNYPELVDLQNQLKDPFLNRGNFQEYIEKGIELIKKSPPRQCSHPL